MSAIPEFTREEIKAVQDTVDERYKRRVPVEEVTTEIRLTPDDRELTECPGLYWQADDCHFIIAKTGAGEYHCQFFYSVREQYGTGVPRYHDIVECVTTLLRVQADHERDRRMAQEERSSG